MNSDIPPFSGSLGAAFAHALTHLQPASPSTVGASITLAELRGRLAVRLQAESLDAEHVVQELAAGCAGGILNTSGPRFFGWVIGGALPAALAADWLTSTWDQNAALYACGPAAAVVEETAGEWLKELLPVAPEASFALVTGAQMAHVTCLAAARHRLLARMDVDVEQAGLSAAGPIRIVTSSEKHGSIVRAVRLLGLGEGNIVSLPVGPDGRLGAEVLEAVLAEGGAIPAIVVLQAGDLNIGAFDDFANLIPIARRYGAWVHIDGAFGLWTGASARFRHLVEGAEHADSWTVDGHKWLNVPYDCGFAFVADREAHRNSMSHRAAYLTHAADARDQMDWTPEWSRRGRGFATYAALRQLGREGVTELIDRCCDCALELVERIGELDGAEVLWRPTINQGLVRFLDPTVGATDTEHDYFTERVLAEVVASGSAFFTATTWRGRRAMRVSVSNWQTTPVDVLVVAEAIGTVLARLRGE